MQPRPSHHLGEEVRERLSFSCAFWSSVLLCLMGRGPARAASPSNQHTPYSVVWPFSRIQNPEELEWPSPHGSHGAGPRCETLRSPPRGLMKDMQWTSPHPAGPKQPAGSGVTAAQQRPGEGGGAGESERSMKQPPYRRKAICVPHYVQGPAWHPMFNPASVNNVLDA